MSGRKAKMRRLKRGQTIVAEREPAETESERMRERKRTRRKHITSVVIALLMMGVLALLAYITMRGVVEEVGRAPEAIEADYAVKAQIIDETGREQVSMRTRQYVGQLEQDLRDLGYEMTKVVLPVNTSRELYVDLAGVETYFKVSMERDTAIVAEDMARVLRYLQSHDLHPEYADVRIEGKAYYK